MRWYFRKWMVVAEPVTPGDETCVSAAQHWNAVWIGQGINRYFSRAQAEEFAIQETTFWAPYATFVVVDRQTWHEGWA